jgi:hypothetical protein
MPSRTARMARLLPKDQRELRWLPRCVFVDTGEVTSDTTERGVLGLGWSGWGTEPDVLVDEEVLCDELLCDKRSGDELLGDELLGDELLGDELLGDELLGDELL